MNICYGIPNILKLTIDPWMDISDRDMNVGFEGVMLICETKRHGLDNRHARKGKTLDSEGSDRRGSKGELGRSDVASGPSNASILITNCVTAAFRRCHGEFV